MFHEGDKNMKIKNEKLLYKICGVIDEEIIECIYTNKKIDDFTDFVLQNVKYHIYWKEEDVDLIGSIIDNETGEFIGNIIMYRLRMFISDGNIEKEVRMGNDPKIYIG